jgi:hypothetical protein
MPAEGTIDCVESLVRIIDIQGKTEAIDWLAAEGSKQKGLRVFKSLSAFVSEPFSQYPTITKSALNSFTQSTEKFAGKYPEVQLRKLRFAKRFWVGAAIFING